MRISEHIAARTPIEEPFRPAAGSVVNTTKRGIFDAMFVAKISLDTSKWMGVKFSN
jgi:hypothetical protein